MVLHMDLKKNLGHTDRVIRAALGFVLIGLAYAGAIPGWWAVAAAAFGLIQLVEAYAGY